MESAIDLNERFEARNFLLLEKYNYARKQMNCSCGHKKVLADNEKIFYCARCDNCGTHKVLYYLKEKEKTEFLVDVFYELEEAGKENFNFVRYDRVFTWNWKEEKLVKQVRKKGYIAYVHDESKIYAYLLQKNGKFKQTENLSDLLKRKQNSEIEEHKIQALELQKCDYFYNRTGFKETVVEPLIEYVKQKRRIKEFEMKKFKVRAEDLVKFIQFYKNMDNENIEQLSKAGFAGYAKQFLRDKKPVKQIMLKKKDKLVLPIHILRVCQEEGHDENVVKALVLIEQLAGRLNQDQIEKILPNGLGSYKTATVLGCYRDLIEEYHYQLHEIISYLQRIEDYEAFDKHEAVAEWRDYVQMGVIGEMAYERFPRSLKIKHDLMNREFKFVSAEKYNADYEKLKERFTQYEYQNDEYVIIVPQTTKDIVNEGKKLLHCVGSYIKKIIDGRSVILFARKKDDLSKSFYTIEVLDGGINQVKGKGNHAIQQESLKRFIQDWSAEKKLHY